MFMRKVGEVAGFQGRHGTLIMKEGFWGGGMYMVSGTEWSTVC